MLASKKNFLSEVKWQKTSLPQSSNFFLYLPWRPNKWIHPPSRPPPFPIAINTLRFYSRFFLLALLPALVNWSLEASESADSLYSSRTFIKKEIWDKMRTFTWRMSVFRTSRVARRVWARKFSFHTWITFDSWVGDGTLLEANQFAHAWLVRRYESRFEKNLGRKPFIIFVCWA